MTMIVYAQCNCATRFHVHVHCSIDLVPSPTGTKIKEWERDYTITDGTVCACAMINRIHVHPRCTL